MQRWFNVGSALGEGGQVILRQPSQTTIKHETVNQCCVDVGPPSTTSAHHQPNIGSISRVCWRAGVTYQWQGGACPDFWDMSSGPPVTFLCTVDTYFAYVTASGVRVCVTCVYHMVACFCDRCAPLPLRLPILVLRWLTGGSTAATLAHLWASTGPTLFASGQHPFCKYLHFCVTWLCVDKHHRFVNKCISLQYWTINPDFRDRLCIVISDNKYTFYHCMGDELKPLIFSISIKCHII